MINVYCPSGLIGHALLYQLLRPEYTHGQTYLQTVEGFIDAQDLLPAGSTRSETGIEFLFIGGSTFAREGDF